jgi:hypothetical protein
MQCRERISQRHAAERFEVAYSFLQRRCQQCLDMTLRNKRRNPIYFEGLKDLLVPRLTKLSARGFGIDSEYVRKVSFRIAQLNKLDYNFSVKKKVAVFDWLSGFRRKQNRKT